MTVVQKKRFSEPDEEREFPNGKVELVKLGNITFGRATLQPGWRWSESVKPLAHTERCEAQHLQYHLHGCLHVVMEDGTEEEFGPGDVSFIPPGHDAWVVGEEPVVVIDISGMAEFAVPHEEEAVRESQK